MDVLNSQVKISVSSSDLLVGFFLILRIVIPYGMEQHYSYLQKAYTGFTRLPGAVREEGIKIFFFPVLSCLMGHTNQMVSNQFGRWKFKEKMQIQSILEI